MSRGRTGTTLLEVFVALLLGVLVVTLAGRTLLHAGAVSRGAADRDDRLLSRRAARLVLRSEVAAVGPSDLRTEGGDSLRLRAVRGAGRVCGAPRDSVVVVDLRSRRVPDPAKDSLEIVGSLGRVEVVALVGVAEAAGACGASPEGSPMRLTADEPISPDVLFVRVFETGSYHLTRGALRYRIGRGGRQPMTPDVWSPASSLVLDGDWLRATLHESAADSLPVSILVLPW